jgi:hypothetical protein
MFLIGHKTEEWPAMPEETIEAATEDERGTINALIAACTDFMALVMARTGPPTDQEVANALEAGAAFSVIVQLSPTVTAALAVQRPGEEPEIKTRWVPSPAPTEIN